MEDNFQVGTGINLLRQEQEILLDLSVHKNIIYRTHQWQTKSQYNLINVQTGHRLRLTKTSCMPVLLFLFHLASFVMKLMYHVPRGSHLE